MYHTAVQGLQTYCLSKADQVRRTSVQPTERLYTSFSEMLRTQDKQCSLLTSQGQEFVNQMQGILCKALQIRGSKASRAEAKAKKGDGFMKFITGRDKPKGAQVSMSQEQQLVAQQEQVKADMEMHAQEYARLVKDSQQFRGQYAYKLAEVIDSLEKCMKYNVEQISTSIYDYSRTCLKHENEMAIIMDTLSMVRTGYLMSLGHPEPQAGGLFQRIRHDPP